MPLDKHQTFAPAGSVQVAIVRDAKEAVALYEQRGYAKVGSAWFTSSRQPHRGMAMRKAREVGAEQVVIGIISQEIVSDVTPIVTYAPGQTYNTSFNGNSRSGSQTTYFNGYATTTTRPQLETHYIPTTRRVTTYEAVFLRRLENPYLPALNNLPQ